MAVLKPKDFIRQVLIDELKPLTTSSPYISFALMAIGIEFLGKCLDISTDKWNTSGQGKSNFTNAIKSLAGFRGYVGYEEALFEDLRCGFAHSFVPGHRFTLSSKDQVPHMFPFGNSTNLRCEDFYADFRNSCEEVINITFPASDKMNRDLLQVPGTTFSESESETKSQSIFDNTPPPSSGTTSTT